MKTINWGDRDNKDNDNQLNTSSLINLPWLVREFGLGRLPLGWRGNQVFENKDGDLPTRAYGYYKEFYRGPFPASGSARVVLGQGGEVYVTENHYHDFVQVLQLPAH
jgi:ribonuclease